MTTHEWRENDADNQQVYHRAYNHAGRWTFSSRPKGADEWTQHNDSPPLDLLESFREVLWNKVQRRRVPQKHIEQIDAILEDLRMAQSDPE